MEEIRNIAIPVLSETSEQALEEALAENSEFVVELPAEIVSSYVSNNVVPARDLPGLIADVHRALTSLSSGLPRDELATKKQKPAVPVKKSVQDDRIACLECA
jgi:predicted transcriptional regulator